MKRGLLSIMVILLLLAPFCCRAESSGLLRGYVKGQGYQYACVGQYPFDKDGNTAPVLWRVLSVENGQALLMTEYVIDTTQIIFEDDPKIIEAHSYRRISSWAESDACPYLNSTVLDNLMGDDPIKEALIDKPGFGRLFVLTMEEYCITEYGFSSSRWGTQRSRWAEGTPYALKQRNLYKDGSNGMVCYWASSPKDPNGYYMDLVGYDGHISEGAYTRTNVGIRPCILVDLSRQRHDGRALYLCLYRQRSGGGSSGRTRKYRGPRDAENRCDIVRAADARAGGDGSAGRTRKYRGSHDAESRCDVVRAADARAGNACSRNADACARGKRQHNRFLCGGLLGGRFVSV